MDIKVRKMNFKPGDVPIHWFGKSSLFTHLANSLCLVFPEGERFFIRSVKRFSESLNDPKLKEEVKAFIAQEVQHGKAHEEFFSIYEKQGLEHESLLNKVNHFLYKKLEPSFYVWGENFADKFALSVTAAMEHYTASLADNVLKHPFLFEYMDPQMKKLLSWHAIEEIEHKHVAYDVLQLVDSGYLLRFAGMALASSILFGVVVAGTFHFMRLDKFVTIDKLAKDLLLMITNPGGFIQTVVRAFFDYLSPEFHPKQIDNYKEAKQFAEKLGLNEVKQVA